MLSITKNNDRNNALLEIYKLVLYALKGYVENTLEMEPLNTRDPLLKKLLTANGVRLTEESSVFRQNFKNEYNEWYSIHFIKNAKASQKNEDEYHIVNYIEYEGVKNIIVFLDYYEGLGITTDDPMGYSKYVEALRQLFRLFIVSSVHYGIGYEFFYTISGQFYNKCDIHLAAYIIKEFYGDILDDDFEDVIADYDQFKELIMNNDVYTFITHMHVI